MSQQNVSSCALPTQTVQPRSGPPKSLSKAPPLFQPPSSGYFEHSIVAPSNIQNPMMSTPKQKKSKNSKEFSLSQIQEEDFLNKLPDYVFQDYDYQKNQAPQNLNFNPNSQQVKLEHAQREGQRPKSLQVVQKEQPGTCPKRKNNRKVRTMITKQKLQAMNKIFAEYLKNRDEGGNMSELNLKKIGKSLQLGYSTILHKFREFRTNKWVKAGVLVFSSQCKRKYKKSLELEKLIDRALQLRPFYTAVELSDYLFKTYNKRYSRSIISRHLCEMGYSYKNLKTAPIQKHKPIFRQTRKAYASILYPLLSDSSLIFLYIDELACDASMFQSRKSHPTISDVQHDHPSHYVSLFISATAQGVIKATVKRGFFTKQEFIAGLDHALHFTVTSFNQHITFFERIIVVTDMNKIHLDPFDLPDDQKPINCILQNYQAQRYFLPPSSPHFNPIESIFASVKEELFKKEILGPQDLQVQLLKCAEDLKNRPVEPFFLDVEKCLKQELEEEPKIEDRENESLVKIEK